MLSKYYFTTDVASEETDVVFNRYPKDIQAQFVILAKWRVYDTVPLELIKHKLEHVLRKGGETAVDHCVRVKNLAKSLCSFLSLTDNEKLYVSHVALLHDILEDSDMTAQELYNIYKYVGYSTEFCKNVVEGVVALSDHYVPTEGVNRLERKRKEADRLGECSDLIKLIKIADLIDNTNSMHFFDEDFQKIYKEEKRYLASKLYSDNFPLTIKLILNGLQT